MRIVFPHCRPTPRAEVAGPSPSRWRRWYNRHRTPFQVESMMTEQVSLGWKHTCHPMEVDIVSAWPPSEQIITSRGGVDSTHIQRRQPPNDPLQLVEIHNASICLPGKYSRDMSRGDFIFQYWPDTRRDDEIPCGRLRLMPRILFRWWGHEPLNETLVALGIIKEEVFSIMGS